jgi:hypothetical protein
MANLLSSLLSDETLAAFPPARFWEVTFMGELEIRPSDAPVQRLAFHVSVMLGALLFYLFSFLLNPHACLLACLLACCLLFFFFLQGASLLAVLSLHD